MKIMHWTQTSLGCIGARLQGLLETERSRMSENGHSTTLAIAYKGGAIGQSYEHWREQICRGFCRLDVEPSKGKRIDCTIKLAPIASLALATAEGVSGQFARTRELLSDGCDDFVLVSATGGP